MVTKALPLEVPAVWLKGINADRAMPAREKTVSGPNVCWNREAVEARVF